MIKVDVSFKKANINMNEELLGILIINVLKNAVNYTNDKKVTLTSTVEQDNYVISIKNKGFIPEDDSCTILCQNIHSVTFWPQ